MHWRRILKTLDASSIIYAWDNYPPVQFPPLWRWLGREIGAGNLSIPQVAFEEVERRLPECAEWLRLKNIERHPMTNDIVQEAQRIKGLLGVVDDNYHPDGVGENDILIIATAGTEGLVLVSNEGRQANLPQNRRRYKIPATCALDTVEVLCIDFLRFIRDSGEVFGEVDE